MVKKALTLHMEARIIDDFRNFCKLNALKLSAKVELLLKQEMEQAPSNPTLVKLFEELLSKQPFRQAGEVKSQERLPVQVTSHERFNTEQQKKEKKIPTIDHLRRVKGL